MPHTPESLTEREKEILRLVINGLTDQEIADETFISVHTVRNHVAHIRIKLGVHNRTRLAQYVILQGLPLEKDC